MGSDNVNLRDFREATPEGLGCPSHYFEGCFTAVLIDRHLNRLPPRPVPFTALVATAALWGSNSVVARILLDGISTIWLAWQGRTCWFMPDRAAWC